MMIAKYLLCTAYLISLYAEANQPPTDNSLTSLPELGFSLIPSIAVNYKFNDNINNAHTDQQGSNITEISPALRIEGQTYRQQISFEYKAKQALYAEDSDYNYTDHALQTALAYDINHQHKITMAYQFQLGHDEANTGILTGDNDSIKPAIFYNQHFYFDYSYGSQSAKASLVPRLAVIHKRYDEENQRYTTAADFDDYQLGLAFYYRVTASINLLVDASHTISDYKNTVAQQDSYNNLLYTGVNWDITGKTQGIIKLGYENINFADPNRESQADPSWDLAINWKPKSYSTFNLNSSQKITHAVTNLSSIKTNKRAISWQHNWRHNLSSSIAYQNLQEVYLDQAREDISDNINITLNYQLRYWLIFGLSYAYEQRKSSMSQLSYDKNVYGITSRLIF